MNNLSIKYYEGIGKVDTLILVEWFSNFFKKYYYDLLAEPKILVSSALNRSQYTIQIGVDNDLKPYLTFNRNTLTLEKQYVNRDYSNIDTKFIELLVKLKKAIRS